MVVIAGFENQFGVYSAYSETHTLSRAPLIDEETSCAYALPLFCLYHPSLDRVHLSEETWHLRHLLTGSP
jgi:hypothetical protein